MIENLASLTFEEAFKELQGALEELRGDALTLDRSLALYERGAALAEYCNTLLTAAELRITESAVPAAFSAGEEPDGISW